MILKSKVSSRQSIDWFQERTSTYPFNSQKIAFAENCIRRKLHSQKVAFAKEWICGKLSLRDIFRELNQCGFQRDLLEHIERNKAVGSLAKLWKNTRIKCHAAWPMPCSPCPLSCQRAPYLAKIWRIFLSTFGNIMGIALYFMLSPPYSESSVILFGKPNEKIKPHMQ